jgi:hypothetical protein
MSWKKYFRPVNSVLPDNARGQTTGHATSNKYNSWLPEVYQGPPDRLQRYTVYETMNLDNEIHAALDTIADFSTENDTETTLPFVFNWSDEPSPTEIKILTKTLKQWCILNEWDKRLWGTFRHTLMYGDQFFIRDPETHKLFWCDPNNVMKVVVNESEGKKIEQYFMKNLDLNLKDLVASNMFGGNNRGPASGLYSAPLTVGGNYTTNVYAGGASGGNNFFQNAEEITVAGEHVMQLTLSDGMSASWPFGNSILEYVYKVYKQKELLEDSILIYRVHRAPERRVFFIDVGTMPPNKAQQYLERVRYEVQQKRIPSRNGGGQNVVDSAYNPMSMLEDYFFATTSDGRGSKVETLPGGENLGDIDDLRYFNNKMLRALGVPSSYLPTGPEDGSNSYNDGRVGTAFIQEFRFSKVCERYQKQIVKPLDQEFKLFLKHRGISIDNALFNLQLTPPQNFSEYRRLELDAAQINVFASMAEVPYISKRFALKRYLGLTEQEIAENEKMWKEEKGMKKNANKEDISANSLGDAGITASGVEGMAPDEGFEEPVDDLDMGDDASLDLDNPAEEVDSFGEE